MKEKASSPYHYFAYSSVSVDRPRAGSLQVLNFFVRGPAQTDHGHIHFATNDSLHSDVCFRCTPFHRFVDRSPCHVISPAGEFLGCLPMSLSGWLFLCSVAATLSNDVSSLC